MKIAIAILLLVSTAVSAQRYSGSADVFYDVANQSSVTLHSHVDTINASLTGTMIASMDLTVDDSQSVIFHEFKIDLDLRFDVAKDVYGTIKGSMIITDHLDLNPVPIDNKFGIKPLPYGVIDATIEWHNRSFVSTSPRNLVPHQNATSFSGLLLDYENYPESITLDSKIPNHQSMISTTLIQQNGYLNLEPELKLAFVNLSLRGFANTVELFAVNPDPTVPIEFDLADLLRPAGKVTLNQLLQGNRIMSIPEPSGIVLMLLGMVAMMGARQRLG